MFKPTSICLSALSKRTKRVKVQILKDFPEFLLYRGEVAQVKLSLMRNYLHNYNGARYILHDNEINLDLLKSFQKKQQELKSAKLNFAARKDHVQNTQTSSATTSPVPGASIEQSSEAQQPQQAQQAQQPSKPKGVLEKDITVKDIKIPGLDL